MAANDPDQETAVPIFTITSPEQFSILSEDQIPLEARDCAAIVEIPRGDEKMKKKIQDKYPKLYVSPWEDEDPPTPSLVAVARSYLCRRLSRVSYAISDFSVACYGTLSIAFASTARVPIYLFTAARSVVATIPRVPPPISADGDVGLRNVEALLAHDGGEGNSNGSLEQTVAEHETEISEVCGAVEHGEEQELIVPPADDSIVASLELSPVTPMVASASHDS